MPGRAGVAGSAHRFRQAHRTRRGARRRHLRRDSSRGLPSGRLTRTSRGYVVLDFKAFDWLEDDEEIIGHPRDPFHRVDIRASSLTVQVELDGVTLAATTTAPSCCTRPCSLSATTSRPRSAA